MIFYLRLSSLKIPKASPLTTTPQIFMLEARREKLGQDLTSKYFEVKRHAKKGAGPGWFEALPTSTNQQQAKKAIPKVFTLFRPSSGRTSKSCFQRPAVKYLLLGRS